MSESRSARPQTVVGPALVALPGGSFLMGNEGGRADERPAHRVQLAPFRVSPQPVTNAEYGTFLKETGTAPPPWFATDGFDDPGQPVVGVNWFEAVAYCEWLARETGVPLRLPTEAEREFATLGGFAGVDWPWVGEHHPNATELKTLDRPHAPQAACANGYGLRCMAENVQEWCSDWYAPDYYSASPVASPTGPGTGVRKASRGGAWRHSVRFTRITARSSLPPEYRYNDYGFRVYADA